MKILEASKAPPDGSFLLVLAGIMLCNVVLAVLSLVEMIALAPFGELTLPSLVRWGEAFSKAMLGAFGAHAAWSAYRMSESAVRRIWFYLAASGALFAFWIAASLAASVYWDALPPTISFLSAQPWYVTTVFILIIAGFGTYLDQASAPAACYPDGFGRRLGPAAAFRRKGR